MNSTAVKPPVAPTKLCHLIKRPDFEGYGFNLHSEKIKPGQFIGKIDVNSPAEAAGLKKGDRIIEVNGVPINNETHKQVVQRIKAIENEVRLLLIDVDGVGVNGAKTINEATTTNHINKINDAQVDQVEEQELEKDVVDNNNTNINKTTTNNHNNNNMITESMQSNLNSSSSQISKDTNQQLQTTTTSTSIAATAVTTNLHINNNNKNISNNANNNNNNSSQHEMPLNNNNNNNNNNSSNKSINGNHSSKTTTTTNTLQLPLTAAEMRAKLMSKKKYDPKSESVDIKKKFQIIQTL